MTELKPATELSEMLINKSMECERIKCERDKLRELLHEASQHIACECPDQTIKPCQACKLTDRILEALKDD